MADKKYQVFVSSTFRDLIEERKDTITSILDLGHIPAGMELFPAADVEQFEYIKKVIDECDYYLLIVGGRYGSLDAEGISFTEREYDYAVSSGKFVVAFVHGAPGSIPLDNSEIDPKLSGALTAFKAKAMSGRLVKTWTTRQDLQLIVLKSLMHAFKRFPQIGWIRGDAAASSEIIEQANALFTENARLRQEVADIQTSLPTEIENLAPLDDTFTVRYEIRIPDGFGLSKYDSRESNLTWRDIFMHVAAKLGVPRREGIISSAIEEALKEHHRVSDFSSLNELDKARIKAQLTVHGLIDASKEKTLSGGLEELLALTARGRNLYQDLIVVRQATK